MMEQFLCHGTFMMRTSLLSNSHVFLLQQGNPWFIEATEIAWKVLPVYHGLHEHENQDSLKKIVRGLSFP